MARKQSATSAAKQGKTAGKSRSDKSEKKFKEALSTLEKVAQERILGASDPFSAAVKMAKVIRNLADEMEKEAESIDSTEAGHRYDSGGNVGIGVM